MLWFDQEKINPGAGRLSGLFPFTFFALCDKQTEIAGMFPTESFRYRGRERLSLGEANHHL